MVKRVRQHNGISARNFIHEEAQKRLKEIVPAAQKISTQSVFVHATPIIYFAKQENGIPCGCRKKVVTDGNMPIDTPGSRDNDFDIQTEGPLFGGFGTSNRNTSAEESLDDDLDDVETQHDGPLQELTFNGGSSVDSIFGNSVACPICCRAGVVPGYQPIGYSRIVMSSVFTVNAKGYFVNSSLPVPRFEVEDLNYGFVEFELDVPLMFRSVKFAGYDGSKVEHHLRMTINGHTVTENLLREYAGKEVILRVKGAAFTHCVFMFQINEDLKADFPQDSRPKDYALFDTTQPTTIVTDKSIPRINNGDVVYKVGYNQLWKVNDFEFFRMNDQTVIGWTISARILQRDEVSQVLMTFK